MKFLALEVENPNVSPDDFQPHLIPEARRVWELYLESTLREIYFRADKTLAVLVLECDSVEQARAALDSLPLVKAGLVQFEIMPLVPYPGLARLFADEASAP